MAAYLPRVADLVRQHFPGDGLTLELEEDPEVEEVKHLLFTMHDVTLTIEELLKAKDEYHRALYQLIPSALVCTFRVKPRLKP